MNTVLQIFIVIASLIILYFAYFMKNELAKLIVFVILGAILIGNFLGILAGIQFLDFLGNIFNILGSVIVFIEVAIIIFLMFFKFKGKATLVLKVATVVLVVLLVTVELIHIF